MARVQLSPSGADAEVDRADSTGRGSRKPCTRMTAEDLNTQYRLQLADALTPPIDRQTAQLAWSYLLREATRRVGGTLKTRDDRTWIWSDLHLGDDTAIEHGDRPFESTEHMNAALLDAWRTSVEADHTIVNLGDVTGAGTPWRRNANALRELPGRKIVVLGNHDFTGIGSVPNRGEDELYVTLLSPGDPMLLLTHLPLRNVPAGTVNVHGHLHHGKRKNAGPYINVCVEQTGYRPIRLTEIRERARKLIRTESESGSEVPTTHHNESLVTRDRRDAERERRTRNKEQPQVPAVAADGTDDVIS